MCFYNVGIQLSEVDAKKWKIKERRLAADIVTAFDEHAPDLLCLSELGEVGVGIGQKIPGGDVDAWILGLLSDSAVPPVRIYTDGHSMALAKTGRVVVEEYKLVKGFHHQ